MRNSFDLSCKRTRPTRRTPGRSGLVSRMAGHRLRQFPDRPYETSGWPIEFADAMIEWNSFSRGPVECADLLSSNVPVETRRFTYLT
jgi:hypothetical protein